MEAQRGSTLVEAVVASALLGIVIVGAMTALDTAGLAAREAVRLSWANCVLRSKTEVVLAAPYNEDAPKGTKEPYGGHTEVVDTLGKDLQVVRVEAFDPRNKVVLAQTFVYKSKALSQVSISPNTYGQNIGASCQVQQAPG